MKLHEKNSEAKTTDQLEFDDIELLQMWASRQRKVQWMVPVQVRGGPSLSGLIFVSRAALLLWLKDAQANVGASWAPNEPTIYRVYVHHGYNKRFISIFAQVGASS